MACPLGIARREPLFFSLQLGSEVGGASAWRPNGLRNKRSGLAALAFLLTGPFF